MASTTMDMASGFKRSSLQRRDDSYVFACLSWGLHDDSSHSPGGRRGGPKRSIEGGPTVCFKFAQYEHSRMVPSPLAYDASVAYEQHRSSSRLLEAGSSALEATYMGILREREVYYFEVMACTDVYSVQNDGTINCIGHVHYSCRCRSMRSKHATSTKNY